MLSEMKIRPLADRVQDANRVRHDASGLLGPDDPMTALGAALAGRRAEKAELREAAEALQQDGVEFRRHKTILGFTREGWTPATPSDVARLTRSGKADQLQARGHGSNWLDVHGIGDLSVLDALHGAGTPQSLPHAILAKTLLALENSGARLRSGSQNVGAYGAYKAVTDGTVPSLCINDLPIRDEEGAFFAGWLAGQAPATNLAQPALAEAARALDARHLGIGADDVLRAYDKLRMAPPTEPLAVLQEEVRLGTADPQTVRDPQRFGAWLDQRQAELRATRKSVGERAVEAYDLLRDDGDARPFAERLDATAVLFAKSPRTPAPLYAAVRGASGALIDRASEMAGLLGVLGPAYEGRAVALFEQVQELPEGAPRHDLLARLRAAIPTFQALSSLLPDNLQDAALQQLLMEEPARLGTLARIAAHVHPWKAEGTWHLGRGDDGALTISDNTSGSYADNLDNALTSAPFRVPKGGALTFGVHYGLENNYDHVQLQISADGRTWKPLARYTGRGEAKEKLDLAPWSEQVVRLRLAIHSDGSNHDMGVRIDHPVVGSTPLDEQIDGDVVSVLTGGADTPALDGLALLAERLDDAHTATLLWPALAADLGSPDFVDRVEAVAAIAQETDAQTAIEVWPEIRKSQTGTIPERLDRLRAARGLVAATCREPRRSDVLALYRKLDGCGADAALTAPLLETAKRARTCNAEETWAEVPFEGGTAWTDSPQGNYKDNADNSATFESMSLEGIHGAKLAFDVKHALEDRFDHAFVEASTGDGQWKTLADFTGQQDVKHTTVDLAAYDGQRLQLRLRIKTDGSNHSDGIYFGNLRVQGNRDDGSTVDAPLADHVNTPILRELTDAATDPALPVAERQTRVETIAELGKSVGSVQNACLLWPLLKPHAGQPGYGDKVQTVIGLQQRYGLQATVEAWPRIEREGPPNFQDRLSLYEAAQKLASTLYTTTRSEHAAALYEALARVGSDRPLAESLTTLATKGQPFIAQGTWGRVADEWQDSPGGPYAANVDASLTTQPFSLDGLQGARLRFDAKYATEANFDWCAVEVSADGKTWKEVARFTGQGQADGVDLGSWDGHRVQVRFHFHSDGSNQADGIGVKSLRVEAQNHPPVPLEDLINAPLGHELLNAATAPDVPLDLRSRNLQAVARMADRLQSTQKAAMLWSLLELFQKADDFSDRAEAVGALAEEYGVDAAWTRRSRCGPR